MRANSVAAAENGVDWAKGALEEAARAVVRALGDVVGWLISAGKDAFDWLLDAADFSWIDDVITWTVDAAAVVPGIAEGVAISVLYGIVLLALVLVALTMWKRMRRVSLVVRAFTDGAVEPKVGAAIAALIEERLVGSLRRKEQVRDGYELDLVITDVDLLTEDNNLAKALERLADVPQLQLVVGVLDLIERLLPSRGLAAAGELLPDEGARGAGLSMALYEGNRLTARSSLWEKEVATWLPGDDQTAGDSDNDLPSYYRLAPPAAWWIQYEAARVLDAHAGTTTSGRSFALVGFGLSRERAGEHWEAEEAYALALTHDPDNVAALVNLAKLLARDREFYAPAALLLRRANDVLFQRHSLVAS